MTGCSTTSGLGVMNINSDLTPERVNQYATFEDFFKNSPYFKKDYYTYEIPDKSPDKAWIAEEHKIPVKAMEMYCKVKTGGEIHKFYHRATGEKHLDTEGSYRCFKDDKTFWVLHILNGFSHTTARGYKEAGYEMRLGDAARYDADQAYVKANEKQWAVRAKEQRKKSQDEFEAKQKAAAAKQDAFEKEVAARKQPTAKDVGKSVCREVKIYSDTKYNQMLFLPNGNNLVVGVLEQVPANSDNIKVSLMGAKTIYYFNYVYPNTEFSNIPIEAGKVIWEKKRNWFVCA